MGSVHAHPRGLHPGHHYSRCSPRYFIPADDKKNARLIFFSTVIVQTIKGLGLEYPNVCAARRRELLDQRGLVCQAGGSP